MRTTSITITLSPDERRTLEHLALKRSLPLGVHQRVRMVLLRADGHSLVQIAQDVGRTSKCVRYWLTQWQEQGLDGITGGQALPRLQRSRGRAPVPPLGTRICAALARVRVPPHALHYTVLAARLKEADVDLVNRTCIRLAAQGRLQWVDLGTYQLRARPL